MVKKYLNQIIVLTVGVVALAGIFVWQQLFNGKEIAESPKVTPQETPVPSVPPEELADTSDWKFYSNELFNFEFEHPGFLSMKYVAEITQNPIRSKEYINTYTK